MVCVEAGSSMVNTFPRLPSFIQDLIALADLVNPLSIARFLTSMPLFSASSSTFCASFSSVTTSMPVSLVISVAICFRASFTRSWDSDCSGSPLRFPSPSPLGEGGSVSLRLSFANLLLVPKTFSIASSLLKGSALPSSNISLSVEPCTASKNLPNKPVSVFWSFKPLYNAANSSSKLVYLSRIGASPYILLEPFNSSACMAALACSTFLAFLKASSWLNSLYASKDF